jgi:hypothetical protein
MFTHAISMKNQISFGLPLNRTFPTFKGIPKRCSTFKFVQSSFPCFLHTGTEILHITIDNSLDKDVTHFAVKSTCTYMQILNRTIFAKKGKGYEGNLKNIRTLIWIWLQHISCKHIRWKVSLYYNICGSDFVVSSKKPILHTFLRYQCRCNDLVKIIRQVHSVK